MEIRVPGRTPPASPPLRHEGAQSRSNGHGRGKHSPPERVNRRSYTTSDPLEESPVRERRTTIQVPRIATVDDNLPVVMRGSNGATPSNRSARPSLPGDEDRSFHKRGTGIDRHGSWSTMVPPANGAGKGGPEYSNGSGGSGGEAQDPGAGAGVAKKKKLGMFKGVLVPTCENMWGVLIFLRFYVIVGNAGLGMSVVIVTLSYLVALSTSLSLSAIATCGTSHSIQGVYPMLARALGKEIATAIGFVYFLGIVFLAVLECLGACEELFMVNRSLSDFPLAVQMWGSIFMFSLVCLVGGGIKLVSHLGLVFFAVVVLTLILFYIGLFGAPNLHAMDAEEVHDAEGHHVHAEDFNLGLSGENMANNFLPDYSEGKSFATSLSLFFPCFTGILSGANRASSLADPSTAIPYGTLGAITISYLMYMSYMFLWAAVGHRDFLKLDHGQLDLLLWPSVKLAQVGIVLSSLGQALQCLVVAPRLLASIAQDRVLRLLTPLAVKTAGEPKRALVFAYVVGGLCVLLGSLDLVAPLLSMCFLLCYSFMNLNCFVLDILKDPHWRPKWKYFHWSIGLFGFLLCTALMFTINYIYAIVAFALAGGIFVYILHSNAETDWGSALHGLRFQIAVRSLLAIDMHQHLQVNWKPQLLLLYQLQEEDQDTETAGQERGDSNEAAGHTHRVVFSLANQLRHGSGLTIACAIIPLLESEGEDDPGAVAYADSEKRQMDFLMNEMGVEGFSMTVLTRSVTTGKAFAIQASGLGPLSPNTVVMGWPWWWKKDPRKYVPQLISTVNQCTLQHKAILLGHNLKDFPTEDDEPVQGYIDVWWIKHDGGLLLLLSHLLKKHRLWRRCLLRLHLITETGTNPELIKARMHRLLNMINISATVEEVILVDSTSLLPYMKSSDTRLRNQEASAKQKAMAGVETVEELIENPLPLPDEEEQLRAVMGAPRRTTKSKDKDGQSSFAHLDVQRQRSGSRTAVPPGVNSQASANRIQVLDMRHASGGAEGSASGQPRKHSLSATSAARLELDSYIKEKGLDSSSLTGTPADSEGGRDPSPKNSQERGRGEVRGPVGKTPVPARLPPASKPAAGGVPMPTLSPPKRRPGPPPSPVPAPPSSIVDGQVSPPPSPPSSTPPPVRSPAPGAAPPLSPVADGESPQILLPPSLMDAPMRRSAEARHTELQRFIDRLGLDEERAAELAHIFERSVNEAKQGAVSYMWDEIHEIIQSHSEHSELVIINLPDPPDVQRVDGKYSDEDFTAMVEYMDYMEGLARNLPRVLFVHGAGQEVINFDASA